MKRKRVDSNLERQILIGLCTDRSFLTGAVSILDLGLFQSKYIRIVAEWCISYFKKHKQAPKRTIQNIYYSWVERSKPNDDDADAVRDLLEDLSAESDRYELNSQYLLQSLSEYVTTRRLEILQATIGDQLGRGKVDLALSAVQKFRGVPADDPSEFNPFTSRRALRCVFSDPPKPIIRFPGVAGEFFNAAMTRDSLIAIQGPEKRGKTFWCLEFAYRALRDRRRVAFFEVGDLSERQLIRRVAIRMAGMPATHMPSIRMPVNLEVDEDGLANVDFKRIKLRSVLSAQAAYRAQKRFCRRYRITESNAMFSVHANSSMNVAGIQMILERWKMDYSFVPDVIIIDYADILAPEDARKELRHQVDDTWRALRRLSQDWSACVIAPTQANAASFSATTQSMKHFAESHRKMAHVTGMLGLNQTDDEKEQQVMRLNWIVLREVDFVVSRCLWVAQCIPLGRAFCLAAVRK